MINKYVKRRIPIEAVQWTGENKDEVVGFCNNYAIFSEKGLIIRTLEGDLQARIGDYIIKGVDEEFYPCKEDIFLKTYDLYLQD